MSQYADDDDDRGYLESPIVGSNASIDAIQDSIDDTLNLALADDLTPARALLQTHPEYDENITKWRKFCDCYEANEIYRFIHQHTRESDDAYRTRVKRGYYLNYCESVVDLFVAYLYHAPVARDTSGGDSGDGSSQDKYFSELYEDADLAGTTFFSFMQEVATDAQIFGHVGVLVDTPVAEGVQTEQDRIDRKIRPYLTRFTPLSIRDWEVDRHGRFLWVKLEIVDEDDRTWKGKAGETARRFVIWDRKKWEKWELVSEDEARLVESGQHNLGEVPLVIVRNVKRRNHKWFGESAIRDIADINLAILNWSSFGDEEIANRCLNILTMMRDSTGDAAATISHHNVLEYSEGSSKPEYLTPGETPLEMISKWMQMGKDEIYRIAKLGGSTGLLGVREATSGIAYAYEFNETNQSLAKKAESLEQGEIEIHRLVAAWFKKKFQGRISYPREFGVDDFLMELQILTQARTTLTTNTGIRKVEHKLVDKMFAREPMEFRKKVHQEIDAAEPVSVGVEGYGTVPPGMTKPQSSTQVDNSAASGDSQV